MKRTITLILGLLTLTAGLLRGQTPQHGDPLTADQQVLLTRYEAVRAALAADDLPAAKAAAGQMADNAIAAQLSNADDLPSARKSFFMLSRAVMKFAHGQPGYYIFHCPDAKFGEEWGHWIQTTSAPSNPYLGKANPTCGTIMR